MSTMFTPYCPPKNSITVVEKVSFQDLLLQKRTRFSKKKRAFPTRCGNQHTLRARWRRNGGTGVAVAVCRLEQALPSRWAAFQPRLARTNTAGRHTVTIDLFNRVTTDTGPGNQCQETITRMGHLKQNIGVV